MDLGTFAKLQPNGEEGVVPHQTVPRADAGRLYFHQPNPRSIEARRVFGGISPRPFPLYFIPGVFVNGTELL